ncbi:MAG: hypothetical protein H0V17_09375, partial [Deltaproteobacteria bacterium]|nr:hypothetical protein [Deltaproteobacteria bacterium]
SKVMVAGAYGPAEPFVADAGARSVAPSCTDEEPARTAQPGVRMQAFFDQFPNRSSSTSICFDALDSGLGILGGLFHTSLASPCFDGRLLDVEPDTAGQQLDCASWFITEAGEEVVPPCTDASTTVCWRIFPDPIYCPGNDTQLVQFDHFFPTSEPLTAVIECVVEGG